ncbi:hypothetical protein ACOWNB_00410 [Helicobacter pylori]
MLKAFADIRWHSNGGNPICPHCGNAGKIYLSSLQETSINAMSAIRDLA